MTLWAPVTGGRLPQETDSPLSLDSGAQAMGASRPTAVGQRAPYDRQLDARKRSLLELGQPNTMCTRGLRRQGRGKGGGSLDSRRYPEKRPGEPVVGVDSGAVTPLEGYWRTQETADPRCRHWCGETAGRRKGGLY